jgi:flagellar hook-basal body complex protein FliE
MPTRTSLKTIDEVTMSDLLTAIANKVKVIQWHMNKTRNAEHEFMHFILNSCQQVVQRLHTAEALLQAFVECVKQKNIQDPILDRLVDEASQFLRR